MKKAIFFTAIVFLAGCIDKCPPTDPPAPITDVVFLNKDTANRMIESYQRSLKRATDTQLNSLIVNADSLRAYLSDTSIKNVKLMFAHTLAYINGGNQGVPAGYKSGAFTIVLAGYNDSGNYVFYNENEVMDHNRPCPTYCPTSGTAQNNIFP